MICDAGDPLGGPPGVSLVFSSPVPFISSHVNTVSISLKTFYYSSPNTCIKQNEKKKTQIRSLFVPYIISCLIKVGRKIYLYFNLNDFLRENFGLNETAKSINNIYNIKENI